MKMNKLIKAIAVMGLAAGYASADELLWESDYGATVSTGGYWFAYDDQGDKGSSTVTCGGTLMEKGDEFGPCMESGPVDVDFNVVAAVPNGDYNPFGFAGIGFNILDGGDEKLPEDLSSYSGLSISYTSAEDMYVQVVDDEVAVGYAVHAAKINGGESSATLPWSKFKQPSWKTVSVDIASVTASMREIKFQAHTDNFEGANNFQITNLTLTGGIGDPTIPVFGDLNGFNFDYSVVAGNLVFNGLSEALTVEVFDLQGKMVRTGEISSSANMMSLEGLNASSYVVRTNKGQFLLPLAD
jgi:hypothetical protein